MATVDVVSQVGGQPANFLDIGGGANAEVMANALEVINHDPNQPVVLRRGDRIAQLVIQKVERGTFLEVDDLPASPRGAGGYGSTGAAASLPCDGSVDGGA